MSAPVCKGNGTGLERVHYFPRQLITADDMRAEQEYFRQKIRRHNRFLHGWGVVCGLKVEAAATKETPWRVKINPGYALGPYGDEIYVQEPFCLDLSKCGLKEERDPCDPGRSPTPTRPDTTELYIAIKYVECETRPVRVHPAGCACDETTCEYSRIRDDFKIECLAELPPSHASGSTPPLLCRMINEKELPPCPSCPEDPWVVLAKVTLPASQTTNIENGNIDNTTHRHQLYSTSLLQRQLIACCCKETPATLAKVVSVNPSPGTYYEPPTEITIRFNKKLNSDTVNMSTIKVFGSHNGSKFFAVTGTVSYDNTNKVAVFSPVAELIGGNYRIEILGDNIEDEDGYALDGDNDNAPGGTYISEFTFVPLAKITEVIPGNNTSFNLVHGGSSDPMPSSIVIRFDKGLDGGTVNNTTITVNYLSPESGSQSISVNGAVTYNVQQKLATFIPASAFDRIVGTNGHFGIHFFSIIVNGDEIFDRQNLKLDGNDDNIPGGKFESVFYINYSFLV